MGNDWRVKQCFVAMRLIRTPDQLIEELDRMGAGSLQSKRRPL